LSLPTIACVCVCVYVFVCVSVYIHIHIYARRIASFNGYTALSLTPRALASSRCVQLERERERERERETLSLTHCLFYSQFLSRSLALTHFRSLAFALLLFVSSQPGRHRWKLSTRAARASESVITTTRARMLGACRHARGNRFLIYSLGTLKTGCV